MDQLKIEKLYEEIIKEIDVDSSREGLKETPKRIAKSFKKLFQNYYIYYSFTKFTNLMFLKSKKKFKLIVRKYFPFF